MLMHDLCRDQGVNYRYERSSTEEILKLLTLTDIMSPQAASACIHKVWNQSLE